MKMLCVCTGNSCRSPMVAGFLQSLDGRINACSAGTNPEKAVSNYAVKVMEEIFVNISGHTPVNFAAMEIDTFDLVISCSEQARQSIEKRSRQDIPHLHIELDDPAMVKGSDEKIMQTYRDVRDEIKDKCFRIYVKMIKKKLE